MLVKTRRMTVAEYFALDEASEIRNEFIKGEVLPMPGGTGTHNLVVAYATIALGIALGDRDCKIFGSKMRVAIDDETYVYPDVCVVRGQPEYAGGNEVTLLNPTVVVEVTSPSSLVRDHVDKLALYRSAPSIEGCLILDQERVFAQWHSRADGGWHLRQYDTREAVIPLAPLGCELALAQVYRAVALAE